MRTAHKWKDKPGSFDKLNTFMLFDSSNEFGIPDLKKEIFVPEWLLPVKQRIQMEKSEEELRQGATHFFVDDYHFESVWSKPNAMMSLVEKTGRALTPDFSLYTDYPRALQIWNTYRNRWLGCFWQSQGIQVLPSITWADEQSFDFCFKGVEKGSIVAISTVGVNRQEDVRKLFIAGFEEMLRQIEPKKVLIYGEKAPLDIDSMVDTKWYPSYWKTMRDIVEKKQAKANEELPE